MAQKSVQISNRNANARVVISSVQTHAAKVGAALTLIDDKLPPAVRIGPDGIRAMLDWLAAALHYHNRALERAELEYVAEQADDPPWRTQRDDASDTVRSMMVTARDRVSASLGADQVAAYGLAGPVPRAPAAVAERAQVVAGLLRNNPRDVDDGLGGRFNTATLADTLDQAAAPLHDALAAVATEQRELEAAMLHRDAATAGWTDAYQGVADALTGLYRLAGRGDLAERIRPTSRRASGEEPAPADDASEPAPDDATAPATDDATAPATDADSAPAA